MAIPLTPIVPTKAIPKPGAGSTVVDDVPTVAPPVPPPADGQAHANDTMARKVRREAQGQPVGTDTVSSKIVSAGFETEVHDANEAAVTDQEFVTSNAAPVTTNVAPNTKTLPVK